MSLHGLVAASDQQSGISLDRRDLLIEGMLDMAVRGVVRMP
jgi:hypothetical protein